jgi:hypothetical protein
MEEPHVLESMTDPATDVVPVLPATRNLWTHDPFGGEYDGTYIWGRGSSDDKSGLIGIMYVLHSMDRDQRHQGTRRLMWTGRQLSCYSKVGNSNLLVPSSWLLEWTKKQVERWFVPDPTRRLTNRGVMLTYGLGRTKSRDLARGEIR